MAGSGLSRAARRGLFGLGASSSAFVVGDLSVWVVAKVTLDESATGKVIDFHHSVQVLEM